MPGDNDLVQKLRERAQSDAAARAAAEFDEKYAKFREFVEQYPEAAAAILQVPAAAPTPESEAAPAMEPAPQRPVAAAPAEAEIPEIETISDLVRGYTSDPLSGFSKVRHRTRLNYGSLFRVLEQEIGTVKVAEIDTACLLVKYHSWGQRGDAMARSLIAGLRILVSYGAKVRKSRACRELKLTIHEMQFPSHARVSKREALTRDQANLVRMKAHEMGLHSIALAQAIQYETGLRQTDCIGEYVPIKDIGASEIIVDGKKWIRGLRWSSIDQNLTLRHTRSQTQKELVCDLRKAPMVMDELSRLGERPTGGEPVIISELTGDPWKAPEFRRQWRKIARAAGISDNVKNMDSRPDNDERPRRPHRQTREGQH